MTNEIKALREAVSGLMQKRSSEAQVRELMATDTGLDEGTWADLTDMGLLGLTIDEQFGGAGAGHVEMSAVCEEMGRALLCGPFFSTAVLTPALLTATGDADEAAQVLPTIADGTSVTALAFAEGTSATLPGELGTTASAAGDQWQLTGEKNYVLDAGAADVLYVLAGTADGPAVFAVSRGAAASGRRADRGGPDPQAAPRPVLRYPGAAGRRTRFGRGVFAAALETGGVAMLGEQAGGTYHAMQMAVDYARTRFQFGRAIGSFQAVKHMCADMLLEAESAVSAARHVAAAYDAGDDNRAADLALAQAYCGDAYVTVAATSIQVHGGIGFTWEHPAHLYLRRARTDAQLLGDPAWHRERYLQLKGA